MIKNFILLGLFFVGSVEASFFGGDLTGMEREYLRDVVERFEEIDAVGVVGSECGVVVSALLELQSEGLVVSFSQECVSEGERHAAFSGDPLLSILSFRETLALERFDVIFVAFPGEYRELLRLVYALKGVAHDETLLIFTGVERTESHLAAWRRCVERGVIEETRVVSDGCGQDWREGRFLFNRVFSGG